jgi:hypothetical protein
VIKCAKPVPVVKDVLVDKVPLLNCVDSVV